MEKIRLFIAVQIPAEVRRGLAEVERELTASEADVKWIPEGNFHVTLKFLGYVEQTRVDAVSGALQSAVEGLAPFDVELAGVGAFPRISSPSVVWVGVSSGGEELKSLAERVESALEGIGFTREERPFSGHITLGRVKSPRNRDRLRDLIGELRERKVGSFKVESVSLMRSDLRPTGPIYTRIAEAEMSDV